METLGINAAPLRMEVDSYAGSRRRRVRHRVHTPAYAALNGSSTGHNLELNEVVNISEDGLALQCSAALALDETLQVCLDLSETGARIETPGRVVWLDSGKVGFCFPEMAQTAQRQLKEWLFINAIMACSDQCPQIAATPKSEISPETQPGGGPAADAPEPFTPDYTDTLTALSAVSREARALGPDLDGALQLIAQRAVTFVRGNGAAIALAISRNVSSALSTYMNVPAGAFVRANA